MMPPALRKALAPGDRAVPWLFRCRKGWRFKPIKYLCSVNGSTLTETTPPDYEFVYIDISSVDSEGRWTASEPIAFSDAPSRARRVIRAGDVLVSTVRTYLRAITHLPHIDHPTVCSTGFAVLTAGENVYPGFLAYWARSCFFVDEIVARSLGVSYPAINASEIGNLPFPCISIDEQSAIATFLNRETARIDALIGKKQRQIELLQERRSALISHAVTEGLDPNVEMKDSGIEWLGEIPAHWDVMRIKHAISIRGGQVDPRINEYGAMILLAPNHIESGTGRILGVETAEDQGAISGKYLFQKGDVLYGKIRPELAKACLAPEDGLCSADMYAMVPKHGNVSKFILYLLLCDAYTKLAVDESMRVAMPKINREDLGEIKWPFPPHSEQERIVEAIEARTAPIDRLLEKVQASIEKLREYRSALISAAVIGKIDVREEARV